MPLFELFLKNKRKYIFCIKNTNCFYLNTHTHTHTHTHEKHMLFINVINFFEVLLLLLLMFVVDLSNKLRIL